MARRQDDVARAARDLLSRQLRGIFQDPFAGRNENLRAAAPDPYVRPGARLNSQLPDRLRTNPVVAVHEQDEVAGCRPNAERRRRGGAGPVSAQKPEMRIPAREPFDEAPGTIMNDDMIQLAKPPTLDSPDRLVDISR